MRKILLSLLLLATSVALAVPPKATLGGAMAPAPSGSGYIETLNWIKGASCGQVVGASTVTCQANVYSCQGTCTVSTTSTGCTSTTSTWNKIGSLVSESGTYTDSTPVGGSVSYCVTDVATGGGWNSTESGPSNVFTQTFPVQAPSGLAGTHN